MKFRAMMRHDEARDDLSGTYVDGNGVRRTVKDGLADPRDLLDWDAFADELESTLAEKTGFLNGRPETVSRMGGRLRYRLFPDGKYGCGVLVWVTGAKSKPVLDEKVDYLKVGFMMRPSVDAVWDAVNSRLKERTGVGIKIVR